MQSITDLIRPSSAHRWMNCTGWALMNSQLDPEEDSPDAIEGRQAHAVAELLFKGQVPPPTIPDEMKQATRVYHDYVMKVCEATGGTPAIEQRREFNGHGGTIDCYAIGTKKPVVDIFDFKYGHVEVEAFENWQLIDYLWLLLKSLNGLDTRIEWARLHIIQPRCFSTTGPIKKWGLKLEDLRGYFNQLEYQLEMVKRPDPKLKPGAHCKNCRAMLTCPAALKGAVNSAADPCAFDIAEIETLHIGRAIKLLSERRDLIGYYLAELEAKAEKEIRAGVSIPYLAVERGRGCKVWKNDDADVIATGDLFGVDLRKPSAALTPTQAAPLLPKEIWEGLVKKIPGQAKIKVVPLNKAEEVFKNVE